MRFCMMLLLTVACRHPADDTYSNRPSSRATTDENATLENAARNSSSATDRFRGTLAVGGDVKAPVLLSREGVLTTPGMKCRGLVLVEAVIDSEGAVSWSQDTSPSPDSFTRAYAEAVKHWRFQPATLHGDPVSVHYSVVIKPRCQ